MNEPVPEFAPGDRVRVLRRFPPGHVRTPWYCRGKPGEVERICGRHRDPEQLAYGNRDAEYRTLYRVRFASRVLWPDGEGDERDRVEVEIYEHWLAPEHGDAR